MKEHNFLDPSFIKKTIETLSGVKDIYLQNELNAKKNGSN